MEIARDIVGMLLALGFLSLGFWFLGSQTTRGALFVACSFTISSVLVMIVIILIDFASCGPITC